MSDYLFENESLNGRILHEHILELATPESFEGQLTYDHAVENVAAINAILEENPDLALLYQFRDLNISIGARNYFMKEMEFGIAMAVITPSAATRMIANFILLVKSTPVPIKLFNKKAEALEWLNAQIDNK